MLGCVMVTLEKWNRLRRVNAGSELPADSVYILEDGWAIVYGLSASGARQILNFVLPGDIIGYEYSGRNWAMYRMQVLTDAIVRSISKQRLADIWLDQPRLAMQVVASVVKERNLAYERLWLMGQFGASRRVPHLLLELFVRSQRRWPVLRNEILHLPITQQDLGEATGLSGVHVNRILRHLKERGILEFQRHKLCVLDPEKFVRSSGTRLRHSIWIPQEERECA